MKYVLGSFLALLAIVLVIAGARGTYGQLLPSFFGSVGASSAGASSASSAGTGSGAGVAGVPFDPGAAAAIGNTFKSGAESAKQNAAKAAHNALGLIGGPLK